MATFIKCKQDSIKIKQSGFSSEIVVVPYLLFFKKEKTICVEIPGETTNRDNTPINIDVVITISKNSKKLSKWENSKPGILFTAADDYFEWYYDNEKIRDEQFDEIISNHHNYKSNISL